VDGLDQLSDVLAVGLADAVLLDNMNIADMSKAVAMVGGRFPLEASGGITLESIEGVASTGVDYASPAGSPIRRPTSTWLSTSRFDPVSLTFTADSSSFSELNACCVEGPVP